MSFPHKIKLTLAYLDHEVHFKVPDCMLGMLEATIHYHKTFHLVKNDLDPSCWFCLLIASNLSEVRICCISGKLFGPKNDVKGLFLCAIVK